MISNWKTPVDRHGLYNYIVGVKSEIFLHMISSLYYSSPFIGDLLQFKLH